MKTKFLWLAALCAGLTWQALAVEDIAVVNDNRVNVRGQASFNGEVITQLKRGEKVTILEEIILPKPAKDEPAKWYRIALPANTPVWVSSLFIKDNAVAVPKLNVRSGPGENFSVIARLEKGAAVKEIRTVGDWKEIEAPASAYAFVAADLLKREGSAGDKAVLAAATPAPGEKPAVAAKGKGKGKNRPAAAAPAAPVTVETVTVNPPPAVVTTPEPAKPTPPPAPVVRPVEVAAVPATPAPAPAPTPAAAEPPKAMALNDPANKAKEEEKKPGFFSRVFGKSSKTNTTEKAASAPRPKTAVDPLDVVVPQPLEPRVVTREGIVRRDFNLQTPSYYALESRDTGKVINYLFSTNTNIPWAALRDRRITVSGEEVLDKRWPNTPVLKIETLSTWP